MEHKEVSNKYFNGNFNATSGVINKYGMVITSLIMDLISGLKREGISLDYLVVIHMNGAHGKQMVKLTWEECIGESSIEHCRTFEFHTECKIIKDKFYVIDDGTCCTILFPYEY